MTIKAPKDKMIRSSDEEQKEVQAKQPRVRKFFVPKLGKRVEAKTAEEAAAKAEAIINKGESHK